MIRLARPDIDADDLAAVARTLETGYLVQGEAVAQFEEAVAARAGAEHAVAVSSGTSGLFLALRALGTGPGDEVIVPAYSWPATANVVTLCGATPVFADIDPVTWNIDPEQVEDLLRRNPHITAIMPVHAFGGMADMPAIAAAVSGREVHILEDAACALGAQFDGRAAGSWGTAGGFSFHPRKIVTTGEGGMITTDDNTLATALRTLRNHGLDPTAPAPTFVAAGFNLRLTEFQGALGMTQLAKLDRLLARHREVAGWYAELLPGDLVTLPTGKSPGSHTFQSYVVLVSQELAGERDAIIADLRSREIEATIGTYHIPLTTFAASQGGYHAGDFPVTDSVACRAIALPMHSGLTADESARVAKSLTAILHDRMFRQAS
jgi:perosamine synthetase